jgi:hypothetical protein
MVRDDDALRRTLRQVEREIAGSSVETVVTVAHDGSIIFRRGGAHDRVTFHDVPAEALRGAHLTHNHPHGMSFSVQDVRLLLTYRIAEIRVVTDRFTYTLALPADSWEDVEHLIAWTHQRLRDEGRLAVNLGAVDQDEHEATFLHRLRLEIADIRAWNYQREERR